jgi:hypothetical protein
MYGVQITYCNTRLTRRRLTAISGLSAKTGSWSGDGSLFFPLAGLLDVGWGEDMSMGLCAGVEVLESEESISSSEDGGEERGEEEALMLGDGCAWIPISSKVNAGAR